MIRPSECMYIRIDPLTNHSEWKAKYCILWLVCRLVAQAVCDMNVNEDKLSSSPGHFGAGHVRNLSLYTCLKSTHQLFYSSSSEPITEGLSQHSKNDFKVFFDSAIWVSPSMHEISFFISHFKGIILLLLKSVDCHFAMKSTEILEADVDNSFPSEGFYTLLYIIDVYYNQNRLIIY